MHTVLSKLGLWFAYVIHGVQLETCAQVFAQFVCEIFKKWWNDIVLRCDIGRKYGNA